MAARVRASEKPQGMGPLFDTFVAADSRASGEQSRAIDALAAEQARISERVSALTGRVAALETSRTADIAVLEGRIEGIDGKHTAEARRLQVLLDRALAANRALEGRLAGSDAAVAELRRRVDGLEGRLSHVGGEIHRVERSIPAPPEDRSFRHNW